jgi:hypothetical protein
MDTKNINYEIEKFQDGGEGNFYTVTLDGDTFAAKDIIKSTGDFNFNNPFGHGKAWRSKRIFFEVKLAEEKEELLAIIHKIHAALTAAGYAVRRT